MKRYLTVFVLTLLTLTMFAPSASAGPVRNFLRGFRDRVADRRPGVLVPKATAPQQCPCSPYCPCPDASAPWGCYPPAGTYSVVPGSPCPGGNCPLRRD